MAGFNANLPQVRITQVGVSIKGHLKFLNWSTKTHPKYGQPLAVTAQIEGALQREEYPPFACLAFPFTSELIFPLTATADSVRTSVSRLPSLTVDQQLYGSFLDSADWDC